MTFVRPIEPEHAAGELAEEIPFSQRDNTRRSRPGSDPLVPDVEEYLC